LHASDLKTRISTHLELSFHRFRSKTSPIFW